MSADPFVTLGIGDTYSVRPTGGDERALAGPDRSQFVRFSYAPATDTYQISLPNFETGNLVTVGLNGSAGQVATSTVNKVALGGSTTLQPVNVTLQVPGGNFSKYSFTSFGSWLGALGQVSGRDNYAEGYLAYGIPTKTGDVPVTGTGSYSAQVYGSNGDGLAVPVTGDVTLSFDFAAGTLAGTMHAGIFDNFDGDLRDYGQYAFTQTVYSRGATNFSGAFIVPGIPDGTSRSFFEGAFTGPGAAEIMARFEAPYLFKGQTGMMSGIWIGKKN